MEDNNRARVTLSRMLATLMSIYRPRYILINFVLAIAYYYLYITLLKVQNYGIVLLHLPQYLLYLLIITSSMAFTVAVYSIWNSRRNKAYISASTVGTLTTLVGGVIGGCNCAAPLLFSFVAVGFSTSQIITLTDFVSKYQTWVVAAMIAINLAIELYYLNKLSTQSCRIIAKGEERR